MHKGFSILFVFLLSLTTFVLFNDNSYPGNDYDELRKAKELLVQGRYSDALSLLKDLKRDNHVPDLILLYMAYAERGLGRFEESNILIRKLEEDYPESPFLKKGREVRSRNNISLIEAGGEDLKVIESSLLNYILSYPDDYEVSFLFARYLKKKGDKRAKELFLKVYKGNSRFSEEALSELNPSDITAEVLTEKAAKYIKDMEYRKAEAILRKALSLRDDTVPKNEILKKLGLSLFLQKKYERAAEEYMKAGDIYNAARSFFRKGDIDNFCRMLSRLKDMKDNRAGSLIVLLASKKRRDGDPKEALRLFEELRRDYPLLVEEALWGIAWTYYRNGRYSEAYKILRELNERYPSGRYSYWMRRAEVKLEEQRGELESNSTEELKIQNIRVSGRLPVNNFYSALEYLPLLERGFKGGKDSHSWSITNTRGPESNRQWPSELRRFNILLSLGFRDEAVTELVRNVKGNSNHNIAIAASYSLLQNGDYRGAINLLSLIKKEFKGEIRIEEYRDIMYPLAFWSVVEEASERFDIDPLLLLSIIREESRFEAEARSPAGALGLMQLMPVTAQRLIGKTDIMIKDGDLKDIKLNITIGAFYLKELLREFGSITKAVAAYNAGEERIREWLKKGNYNSIDEFIEDIPFDETRNYVKRVLTAYVNYYLAYAILKEISY